jgi:hypothetical protein
MIAGKWMGAVVVVSAIALPHDDRRCSAQPPAARPPDQALQNFVGPLAAAAETGEFAAVEAVEAGADGLRRAARFPWYDAETDRLRQVPLPPYEPLAQPSNWEWQPRNPPRATGGNWRWLKWVAGGILAALLGLFLWMILRALLQRYRAEGSDAATGESGDRATEADRIESLPFQLERPQTNLLAEARRHYLAGDYGEAMIYLFSYKLVQLDKSHLIRLGRGKTNRQYLGELRTSTPLWRMLYSATVAFEDVFFGHYPLTRERFEACWNRLDEFHRLIQLSSEGA